MKVQPNNCKGRKDFPEGPAKLFPSTWQKSPAHQVLGQRCYKLWCPSG